MIRFFRDLRNEDITKSFTGLANTVHGRKALSYLYDQFVRPSSLASTDRDTFYRLGQKELVQEILKLSNLKPEDLLETVKTITSEEDDDE